MKVRNLVCKVIECEKAHVTFWFNIDEKIRFALLAAINMGFRYLLFVVLGIMFHHLNYQIVLALMWFLSSFVAFYSYKRLVFRTKGNHLKEYGKSVVTWILSYLINAIILYLLVEKLQMNVYVGQAIAIAALLIINYLLFKHFAFKKEELTRWERFLQLFDNFVK